jgi:hypothetical protein
MDAIKQWSKANGGPLAPVVIGLGLLWVFWPLGAAFIVVGVASWIYSAERFPFRITRKQGPITRQQGPPDRRELLQRAQAVVTELETCRLRIGEAKAQREAWPMDRQLPAETYNTRWTPSLATADQLQINETLRAFYVWADHMNGKLGARVQREETAIGWEFHGPGRALGEEDLQELNEGLGRISAALGLLNWLIDREGVG